MTEATEVLEKVKKKATTPKKKKKTTTARGKNKLLTDMMDKESVEIHQMIKKRNPSYPALPKFLLNTKHKIKAYKDKGLQESVLRGFYKRVENWNRTNSLFIIAEEGE